MKSSEKLRIGIVGATGYTGVELLRLLSRHPHVSIEGLTTRTAAGKEIAHIFPSLKKVCSTTCSDESLDELSKRTDLVFIALPHGEAANMVTSDILNRCKIIDLGADFRLEDPLDYRKWYHLDHPNPLMITEAVYGLPEFNREKIRNARLIANPGCYATCSILSLAPLLKNSLIDEDSIIVDAKSGVSGAGRGLSLVSHFNECNESFKAYAVASHRHTPEIEQALKQETGVATTLSFTPHLVPMDRGILVTAYAKLRKGIRFEELQEAYADSYRDEHFIRIYDSAAEPTVLPETRWVRGSNFCDIFFKIDERTNRVIVVATIDNLVKGAAGQAIQNMNLMSSFDERLALEEAGFFP